MVPWEGVVPSRWFGEGEGAPLTDFSSPWPWAWYTPAKDSTREVHAQGVKFTHVFGFRRLAACFYKGFECGISYASIICQLS